MHCPDCDGDGGWESAPRGYDHINGEPITDWIKCRACNGSGQIEDEDDPMTMEDALMLDAEILRSQGVEVDDPDFLDLEYPVAAVRVG